MPRLLLTLIFSLHSIPTRTTLHKIHAYPLSILLLAMAVMATSCLMPRPAKANETPSAPPPATSESPTSFDESPSPVGSPETAESPTPPQVQATAPQSTFLPFVHQGPPDGWPMAGANPGRTSWTVDEVTGDLKPVWFHRIDAYISQRTQIIVSNYSLYISAADGLHALDATNGAERWHYPTSQALGHSPTLSSGVLYVGGLDRRLHAVDASDGKGLWTFKGGAGFETSPLVVEGFVLAGNRDGIFYAVHASGPKTGQLAWKYATGGPIVFSAAYKDGLVYFASNDNYAYALRARDGSLVWKSEKLPGHGFHSYWPVVHGDYVVFGGSYNYRYAEPFSGPHTTLERQEAFPAGAAKDSPLGPEGTEPGDWLKGTRTINALSAAEYFEKNPHRRTYIVLNRNTGQEFTYDSDGDGNAEYAPILWFGTHSGTRYPSAVGPDGVLYQGNSLFYDPYIPRGRISGWKFGTPIVSVPVGSDTAVDEPIAYAIGGNTVYWKRCCDRVAGAFQIDGEAASGADLPSWNYYDDGGRVLRRTLPDLYANGWDYAYWKHGDQSPPIPYRGKVYILINNAVVAFAPEGLTPVLSRDLDLGSYTGQDPKEIERGQTVTGLNTKVTFNDGGWPLLIQQESYYSTNPTPSDSHGRWFSLAEIAGSGSPSGLSKEENRITTKLVTSGMTTRVSHRSPTTLFETGGDQYQIRGNFTGLAFPTSSGVRVVNGDVTFSGGEMSSGWLLLWDNSRSHRWSPLLLSLQRSPSQVILNGNGLNLSFSGAAGLLGVTPFYGMSAPLPAEMTLWPNGLSQDAAERAALLDRIARAFPDNVQENGSIADNGNVQFRYDYSFIEFPGEWNTPPLRLALLPPATALAAWNGSPIRINGAPLEAHLDLNYVTPMGRVAGVADSASATVDLPGLAAYWRNAAQGRTIPAAGDPLGERLIAEVRKIVSAGHLLPSYGMVGIWESRANNRMGDSMADYWKNPSDTVYTLLQALPLLPGDLQGQVKEYVRQEFQDYPLYDTAHVGWNRGASRDYFDIPPEVLTAGQSVGPQSKTVFNNWNLPPHNFYALWMYAREFGGAGNLFNQAKDKLDTSPRFTTSLPYVLNSYIAGFTGYLRLAELAGAGRQLVAERELVNLLILRAALSKYPRALAGTGFEMGSYSWTVRTFMPDSSDTLFNPTMTGTLWDQIDVYGYPINLLYGTNGGDTTGGFYALGIDFINLMPETAVFLRDYAQVESSEAVDSYINSAPFWFVAMAEQTGGEGVLQPIYDRWAYFQAKARIQRASRGELEGFLDVPAVAIGDLYYIQNLVATLQAP